MKDSDSAPQKSAEPAPAPDDAFKELVAKLVKVPKKEADRKEAEYPKDQKKKPRRGPKSA